MRALLPLAVFALAGAAAPADAAPVALDLNYTCTFPLIKPQPLKLHVETDVPSELAIGKSTGQLALTATASVSADATFGLRALEAVTVEGTAVALTDVVQPSGSVLVAKVPTTVPKVPLPTSGGFDTAATGLTPSLVFRTAGTAKLNVRDLVLTLTPRLADGTLSGLDTFETECAQDPGQANTLASIKITDPSVPAAKSYGLSGQAYLKTLAQGTVPITGASTLTADAAGALTGDVTLDPARASLKALNFLPLKANFLFSSVEPASGSLTSSTLALTTKQNIRLTNVTVFGINLVTGTCQTATPSTILLKSAAGAFTADGGGSALGTFSIAQFASCGALGSIVSGLAAGGGNAVSLKFTPKTAA